MRPPYGGVPGLCGDPFGGKQERGDSNFAGMPCDPQETYEEGGIISLQIDVAANHGGFFEVYICDSKDISQDCFDRNKLTTCAVSLLLQTLECCFLVYLLVVL